ncbi:uncharacterized protein LOC132279283 [Cornus florida]|uniref:uncharacterized protein LOC132279283 n=1 Tax=Cornus florida TaxID=4283 RepID=UPI002896DF94|nr:uncharacterized protein LOC132279283 [Cornus florida]
MGLCFSSTGSDSDREQSTAKVVSLTGVLREYEVPVTVSQVLQTENSLSSSFVCNSDRLYYEDFIPALAPADDLQAGQIYFVLPTSKLQYRLSASDMAALAVKASVALQKSKGGSHRRNKKAQISPILEVNQRVSSYSETKVYSDGLVKKKSFEKRVASRVSRSGSVKRMQRYSRAKLMARSFRMRLSTIDEGSVLQFYN